MNLLSRAVAIELQDLRPAPTSFLVFEPLKKALGEVKEVFISPDGNLNLIPFEVLQDPDGKFLIEDYTFNDLARLSRFG